MARFSSKAIAEHAEVPLADEGRWEELVDYWSGRQAAPHHTGEDGQRCFVASIGASRDPEARAAQLAEITALVKSQGGHVVGSEIRHSPAPNPRTLIGSGMARELASRAKACGATLLVLDAELSPTQARNLEDAAGIAVCDREAVILNVFLRHARTRRAKVQVEIARLEYLRPRIRGVGLDMDQQTGGTTSARGPGETASELLARKLDDRLEELRKALRKLEVSASTQRRKRRNCKRIVLVGYTNAGKTSLMNALTAAELSARNMPFETLDTTSRCLTRHGGEVLLSDTVGFIRNFPERLLASFESTLTEIVEASLLVIVVDASDHERDLQLETTLELIERMGAGAVPRHYVFTKRDRLAELPSARLLDRWAEGHPHALLDTHDTAAVGELRGALLRVVRQGETTRTVFIPYADGELVSMAYAGCRVLRSTATPGGLQLVLQGSRRTIARLQRSLKESRP